jgi:hypothetical protein
MTKGQWDMIKADKTAAKSTAIVELHPLLRSSGILVAP